MRVSLEVRVQKLERLWRKRRAPFPLLGWLHADEVGKVILAGFVAIPVATCGFERGSLVFVVISEPGGTSSGIVIPFFGLLHPSLQYGFDFLSTFWRYVELLKPAADR